MNVARGTAGVLPAVRRVAYTDVTLDLRERGQDRGFMVWADGLPCSPSWQDKGAAQAYADQLLAGRAPEFRPSSQALWDAGECGLRR